MEFIFYPLIFGLGLMCLKLVDLFIAKKLLKNSSNNKRLSPHGIWIAFLIGVALGAIYELITQEPIKLTMVYVIGSMMVVLLIALSLGRFMERTR